MSGLDDAAMIAEAQRRAQRRAEGKPLHLTADELSTEERRVLASEIGQREKAIEREGDKRFLTMGWEVVKFSHPGATKQTPGIPDRRYYSRRDRLAVWVEWKAPDGVQRPDQKLFQEMCVACGESYLVGGLGDVEAWLLARGLAVAVAGQWHSVTGT